MTWENTTVKKILITEEEIIERSKELGAIVTEAYKDNPPLVVALLRGSVPFLAELIKHIDLNIEYDFMDVSSYVGTESMGDIRILKDLDTSVKGKTSCWLRISWIPALRLRKLWDFSRAEAQEVSALSRC